MSIETILCGGLGEQTAASWVVACVYSYMLLFRNLAMTWLLLKAVIVISTVAIINAHITKIIIITHNDQNFILEIKKFDC